MGQVSVITPFTLSGAMAPVTIAGALVQQNAEALVGMAFSQVVNPGAPVMYGGFTSNVDMKSGAPAFGTPEYMKAQIIGGQLARRYQVPYRTSNVCAANTVDAQAAYESVFSLWGAVQSGMHMLKHGAGWMEGGLCCSYEKSKGSRLSAIICNRSISSMDFSYEQHKPPSIQPAPCLSICIPLCTAPHNEKTLS